MANDNEPQRASCGCGNVTLDISAPPLFRVVCHCSICKAFNNAPFADILVYRARDVSSPAPGAVEFKAWRPPPNVQRGTCARCGKPAIEQFRSPLFPNLAMLPSANLEGEPPPVDEHIFYGSRVDDVDDDVPKHSGYWRSQWAFGKLVFARRRDR